MKYKDELIRSMEWLGKKEDTIFLGQSVSYSGNAIYNTLKTLPEEKRLEVPVFEEVQMGMSTGMAMNGLVPISCFPRFDFRPLQQLGPFIRTMSVWRQKELKEQLIDRQFF